MQRLSSSGSKIGPLRRRRGHQDPSFPGLRMPAGSKAALIRRSRSICVGSQALLQVGQLGRADPVLAGDRATELDGGGEDLGERASRRGRFPRCPRRIPARRSDAGCRRRRARTSRIVTWCRAAIASMRATISASRGLGTLASSRIVSEPSRDSAGSVQRRAVSSASDSVDVTGGLDRMRAGACAGGGHPLEAARQDRLVAVITEQQQRAGVGMQPEVRVLLDRVHAAAVEELQRRRDDPGGEDVGDRAAGLRQRVEVGQAGAAGGRFRQQRHRHLGDHAEGALGPGEQPGQVVAGDILPEPAAGPDDLAGRQDDRQPQHVVAGDAVLEPTQAARAGGDVAADRGDGAAARIRRVEQAVGHRSVVERLRGDAGLGAGQHLLRRHLEDAVHPYGRQHDAAGQRHGAGAEVRAGAARDDRDPVLGSQPQDPGHLLGVRRRDDGIRHAAEQRCRVPRVHGQLAVSQPDVLRSGDGPQLSQYRRRYTRLS